MTLQHCLHKSVNFLCFLLLYEMRALKTARFCLGMSPHMIPYLFKFWVVSLAASDVVDNHCFASYRASFIFSSFTKYFNISHPIQGWLLHEELMRGMNRKQLDKILTTEIKIWSKHGDSLMNWWNLDAFYNRVFLRRSFIRLHRCFQFVNLLFLSLICPASASTSIVCPISDENRIAAQQRPRQSGRERLGQRMFWSVARRQPIICREQSTWQQPASQRRWGSNR